MEVECWRKWYWKTTKHLNIMGGGGVRMGMKDIQLHKHSMEVEVEGSGSGEQLNK